MLLKMFFYKIFKSIFCVLGVINEKDEKFAKPGKSTRGETGEEEDDAPPQLMPEEGPGPEEILQMEQMEKGIVRLIFFFCFLILNY